jgi:glycosyltransferase involved in cell wall biosynthesis
MYKFRLRTAAKLPLVSIVIPTFNKDRYIGETLESIGRQDYPNWEVLVVEDSSLGETENIVARFARKHSSHRVDYSRNDQNYGAAYSRNVGFERARGEFIALIDADDRWLPDHLQVSVDTLNQSGKDLAYSSVLMIEDQTEMPISMWGPDKRDLHEFPYGLFRRNFVTPSATVMRADVIRDVGPWGLGFRYCEDADYWFRCVMAGKEFVHVGGVHCLYRKNHDGATTQRLCGTLEEFAQIADRYAKAIPWLRHSFTAKCTAEAYVNAAKFHSRSNPKLDPSADSSRAPALAFRAWQLRWKHTQHLWRGIHYGANNIASSLTSRVLRPLQGAPAKKAA